MNKCLKYSPQNYNAITLNKINNTCSTCEIQYNLNHVLCFRNFNLRLTKSMDDIVKLDSTMKGWDNDSLSWKREDKLALVASSSKAFNEPPPIIYLYFAHIRDPSKSCTTHPRPQIFFSQFTLVLRALQEVR